MICPTCRRGADVLAEGAALGAEWSAAETTEIRQVAAHLHAQCRGCDCQHGQRKTEPAPVASPVRLPVVADGPGVLVLGLDENTGLPLDITFRGDPMPYAVEFRPGPGTGSPEGVVITKVWTRADGEPERRDGCRSSMTAQNSRDKGWTCDGDTDRLVEVGKIADTRSDGRSRRVPVVVPREALTLGNGLAVMPMNGYVQPFQGEQDHAHLNLTDEQSVALRERER